MSSYDVVVVGAGNVALTAALVARENGATVLILKKLPNMKKVAIPTSLLAGFGSVMMT